MTMKHYIILNKYTEMLNYNISKKFMKKKYYITRKTTKETLTINEIYAA